MAQVYWAPKSTNTSQVVTVTVGGTLSGETFTISAGGVAIASHTDADTVIATARAALVTAWNNSTHPYANTITASNGAGGDVVLTADTAGIPFTVTLNTPGGSATLGQATTQANTSPHDMGVAANWSGGALPTTGDDVLIPYGTPAIYWGLDALSDVLDDVEIEPGVNIGLEAETFKVSLTSTNVDYREYRTTHATFKCTDMWIGRSDDLSTTPRPGSTRVKVDLSTTAARCFVHSSAAQTGLHPPVQIKANSGTTTVMNYGGVIGIAEDVWGATTTISTVYNHAQSARTIVGPDVTVATIDASYGTMLAKSNPSSVLVAGELADITLFKSGTIPTVRGKGSVKRQGALVTITSME